jgi:PAS domain S-box-containing protein
MLPIASHVVFDRIPVAALILEVNGFVIAANAAAARMFGRPAHELEAQPLGALMVADSDLDRLLDSSRHRGEVVHELHFETPQGRRTVECVMSTLEADGRPVFQLFAIDITVRKQSEAAARARADVEAERSAKQRVESLGIIAGGVAHDFNNLLVGVLAESSAAREDAALPDSARDALRRIEAAAQRMAHLTRQMLAYAGRGRFVMQRISPDELLAECAEMLAKLVKPGIGVSIASGAQRSVIEADSGLLRQVIANLVLNASDANSTRITLSSRAVLISTDPWWQLEVADDGAGMTAATMARIFEPFFSTTPERHGLGLSAAHGIVKRFGGEIEVDSKPGEGARFVVRLPIVAGSVALRRSPTQQPPLAARLAGLRVLVADDEPSVRATVKRLLERRGATVVLAADGLEAEDKLRSEVFGLVISDVVMPGRGGYDVLATARALGLRCPIILMSGYTDRVRGEGGEEEPDQFLEKPFTARVLDEAIDEVMQPPPAT